ncbi:MAG: ABC transporter substrate-binding protein [Alphaproteobacteria bacterium]|nr:ABC transporter substrate-binding protein [Alphaproteobacteria bacterium]
MRRLVMTVAAFTAALSLGALSGNAQKSERVWRIGILLSGTPNTHGHYVTWLQNGLRNHGYANGNDYVFVHRWAMGKRKRLPALAKELVQENVDVIIVNGGSSVRAAGTATRRIPIVVGTAGGLGRRYGLVSSLAKPGGNVTGSTFYNLPDLSAKRLALLNEAVPKLKSVAFLFYPLKRARAELKKLKKVAIQRGIKILPLEVGNLSEIERAFASMANGKADAVMINVSYLTTLHRDRLVARARDMKLPSMCEQWAFVESGCLMSYSADRKHMMTRAAYFIDRILKGANPGDLPVERSDKYKLGINLKTAKHLGISLPPSTLLRADEVIE